MDISARKAAERHLQLMVEELNHRVKNTLSVVQAIAHQTFTEGAVSARANSAFIGRLASLAIAHNLLTRTHWERASLDEVLRAVVDGSGVSGERFHLSGPEVALSSGHAVSLSMAVHELCVNAIKYGALSQPAGHVEIDWRIVGDPASARLRLTWSEHGGPAVTVPLRRGFGSTMVEKALSYELGGSAVIHFRPAGIVCEIDVELVPLSQVRP